MASAFVLDFAVKAMVLVLMLSLPALVVATAVGLLVSLFQALTQIQEATLVFIPKILAIFVTLLLALRFMADALHANFIRITSHITGG